MHSSHHSGSAEIGTRWSEDSEVSKTRSQQMRPGLEAETRPLSTRRGKSPGSGYAAAGAAGAATAAGGIGVAAHSNHTVRRNDRVVRAADAEVASRRTAAASATGRLGGLARGAKMKTPEGMAAYNQARAGSSVARRNAKEAASQAGKKTAYRDAVKPGLLRRARKGKLVAVAGGAIAAGALGSYEAQRGKRRG